MGWMYSHRWNKRSLIEERTKNWNNKEWNLKNKPSAKTYGVANCIAHCYRGNNFSGVLWSVWENEVRDAKTDEIIEARKFIECDLLKYSVGEWGYKDMDESVHPYYYSCPLSYLEMAPVQCEEWRQKVRKYHAERKVNFKLKVGQTVKLKDGCNPLFVKIVSLRPLIGENYK